MQSNKKNILESWLNQTQPLSQRQKAILITAMPHEEKITQIMRNSIVEQSDPMLIAWTLTAWGTQTNHQDPANFEYIERVLEASNEYNEWLTPLAYFAAERYKTTHPLHYAQLKPLLEAGKDCVAQYCKGGVPHWSFEETPAIIDSLFCGNETSRRAALYLLARKGANPIARDVIEDALADESKDVRAAALEALIANDGYIDDAHFEDFADELDKSNYHLLFGFDKAALQQSKWHNFVLEKINTFGDGIPALQLKTLLCDHGLGLAKEQRKTMDTEGKEYIIRNKVLNFDAIVSIPHNAIVVPETNESLPWCGYASNVIIKAIFNTAEDDGPTDIFEVDAFELRHDRPDQLLMVGDTSNTDVFFLENLT